MRTHETLTSFRSCSCYSCGFVWPPGSRRKQISHGYNPSIKERPQRHTVTLQFPSNTSFQMFVFVSSSPLTLPVKTHTNCHFLSLHFFFSCSLSPLLFCRKWTCLVSIRLSGMCKASLSLPVACFVHAQYTSVTVSSSSVRLKVYSLTSSSSFL